jgi:hypothetical protein
MKTSLLFIVLFAFGCGSCHTKAPDTSASRDTGSALHETGFQSGSIDYSSGPPTIVYKTKADYHNKIPVLLNDDKTKIVSYPGVKDIYSDGKPALPSRLQDGYLLDNRGIGKNVAFLNITYEEYGRRSEAPSLMEMMNLIVDKNPLKEMYDCGNRYQYKDVVMEMNQIIENRKLSVFKRIF